MSQWSIWLKRRLDQLGLSPEAFARKCDNVVSGSAVRKQIAYGRAPRQGVRMVIEFKLEEIARKEKT